MTSGADTAIVLAGALAKGAFTAGALEVVARRTPRISRVVATSAGALNAVIFAAGVRAGRSTEATARLTALWTRSSWRDSIALSARTIAAGRGVGTTAKLRDLIASNAERLLPGQRLAIELAIVMTALDGTVPPKATGTTFEQVRRFDGDSFDDPIARERIYAAATAAAAFPGLFAPQPVDGFGACIDGGVVNNTPIKHALHGNPGCSRVVVIATMPARYRSPPVPLRTGALAEHVLEILVNERLYRDLYEARAVDARLEALAALVTGGVLSTPQADAVRIATGLAPARRLEIVEIRPAEALPGSGLEGFVSRRLRQRYVDAGRAAAEAAL